MSANRAKTARMDAIYAQHFDAVAAYCVRRLPMPSANDAIAETFLTAWRRLDQVPPGEGTLPYLYRIAGNKVAHQRRGFARQSKLRARLATIAPDPRPGPEMQVLDHAAHREVIDALDTLSDADREIIQLRAWEELTVPQIADVLGISAAAAGKRIERALGRLKRTLTSGRSAAAEWGGR